LVGSSETAAIVMHDISGRERARHVASVRFFRMHKSKEKYVCPIDDGTALVPGPALYRDPYG